MTELLKRDLAAVEASVGDGRTIDLRMVPYNEPTQVDDGEGPYMEEFAKGAFDGQLEHAHRVYLNFQHEKGVKNIVGKGLTLEERDDALYGSFRAFEDADGDKTLLLVREGVLTGASIEFMPKKGGSIRTAAGVVRRIKAHLDAVALCRVGAYAGAGVMGTRGKDVEDADDYVLEAELLPVSMDPHVVERVRQLGFALPDRYNAHPVDEGTPTEMGTPDDDGTREPMHNTSSEE